MRAYSARHITRLASYDDTPQPGYDLIEFIKQKSPEFTNPQIFKLQIVPDAPCNVIVNGTSELTISNNYGLTIDYTDLMINSFVFKDGGVHVYAIIGY